MSWYKISKDPGTRIDYKPWKKPQSNGQNGQDEWGFGPSGKKSGSTNISFNEDTALESTRPGSKFQFALKIYNCLKEKGMLKDGVTVWQVYKWVKSNSTDQDRDSCHEVDPADLKKSGLIKEGYTTPDIEDTIRSRNDMAQYLPDDPAAPSNPYNTHLWAVPGLRPDHSIEEASGHFGGIYRKHSIEEFNQSLQEYFSKVFGHSQHEGDVRKDSKSTIITRITPRTRTTNLSVATLGDSRKRRIDCKTYAAIGYFILKGIKDRNGQSAFNVRLLFMRSTDPNVHTQHLIVIYTERSTGKTFVLDNGQITPVKDFLPGVADPTDRQITLEYMRQYRSDDTEFTQFRIYGDLENFYKDLTPTLNQNGNDSADDTFYIEPDRMNVSEDK